MWVGIVSLVATAIMGGVGYVWKRRFERRGEQESIAIEQGRLKFLTEASSIIDKLEPTVRERTRPMLAAALENSLRTLSEPAAPKTRGALRLSEARTMLALAPAPVEQRPVAANKASANDQEQMLNEHLSQLRKRGDEERERVKKDNEFWKKLYQKPLADVGSTLMTYAMESAERNAAARDLKAFNHDKDVFEFAVFHVLRCVKPDDAAVFNEVVKEMRGRLQELLDELDMVLRDKSDAAAPPGNAPVDLPEPLGSGVTRVGAAD